MPRRTSPPASPPWLPPPADAPLLPLAFISDVSVVGAQFPPVIDAIGWFFPLRHAANAMTTAVDPNVTGSGLSWGLLDLLLAWTVAGAVVVALRFGWESTESGSHAAGSRRPRRAAAS